MAIILAGRFDTTVQVLSVLRDLHAARFGPQEFASYYVNPPGQYGLYPLGMERPLSGSRPGVLESMLSVSGARHAQDAGFRLHALVPEAAPEAAFAVGGAVAKMDTPQGGRAQSGETYGTVEPGAGPMVAICVDRPGTEQIARATLHRHGAHAIERVEGQWENGDWKDSDLRASVSALEGQP